MKISHKILLTTFLAIAIAKIALIFLIKGPLLFPDELCILLDAKHFDFTHCQNFLADTAGDPMPLYAFILSPIYLFFDHITAFKAALALNAILIASLIFPLTKIFGKFLKTKWQILGSSIFILILPEVFTYEKLAITESLFVVINIWFLHYYLNYLNTNSTKSKILSILIAILGAITRPQGFVIPVSMAINEFVSNKKLKKTITNLAIVTLASILLIHFSYPAFLQISWQKITSVFSSKENFLLLITAVKNQINSFTATTFLIPLVIFFTNIWKLKKIRTYLLTFILLHFIASTQHMFGYNISAIPLETITRYINAPIILIMIFATIFIQTEKFSFSKRNILIITALLLPMVFFTLANIKFGLNISLAHFYNGSEKTIFLKYYFIPISLIFTALFIFNQKRILIPLAILIFSISSIYSIKWLNTQTYKVYNNDYSWTKFSQTEHNILFVMSEKYDRSNYQKLKALTDNNVVWKTNTKISQEELAQFDYVISPYNDLIFDKIGTTNTMETVYKINTSKQ